MADVTGSVEIRIEADPTPFERSLHEMREAARESSRRVVRDLDGISTAISDISVDTDRTAASLSRGLDRAVELAQDQIRSIDVEAVLDAGAQQQVSRQLRRVVQESQSAIRAVQVNADLDDATRARLTASLQETVRAAQAQARDIQLEVDERSLAADVREAVAVAEATAPSIEIETHIDNDRISRTGRLLRSVGSAAGSLASAGASAATIGTALGAAVPVAAALVGTLANIAPAAAVGASAILAMGSAAAAVKIGTSGVGDAISEVFAPAVAKAAKASGGGADTARAYADAQRAVKDAVQAAGLANERAARQIEDAERALGDAQKEALSAQEDLNDARHQAAQDLEDLNSQLAGAQLDQRGAILDVQEAEKELAALRAKGSKATKLQLAEAQLAYDRAVQRLKDQRTETSRLGAETVAANKAGVEGSDAVQGAQERVFSAQRATQDAVRALKDAQKEAARTAAQGIESVKRAQEALTQSTVQTTGASVGGVDKLAEAMGRLSPNARAFVREIIALKGRLGDLRLDVQDALFSGFAESLRSTASATLPVFRRGLVGSASALNAMALGAAAAARDLAENGTLGRALDGANRGLLNLTAVPARTLTAFTQLAAAASPLFGRLTKAAADSSQRVGAHLTEAFRSGALEKAIDNAAKLIGDLGDVAGNISGIIGSVFKAADTGAGSFLSTAKEITGALREAFASPQVQAALREFFTVTSTLAKTLGKLLFSALKAVAPALEALGPPLEIIIPALGEALQPVIEALGPLLTEVARSAGALALALLPLATELAGLIAAVLPPLLPLFQAVTQVIQDAAPVIGTLAFVLGRALAPILAQLPAILTPLIGSLTVLSQALFPLLEDVLIELGPSLVDISVSFAEIAVALAPLIGLLATLTAEILVRATPAILYLTRFAGQLATVFSQNLSAVIRNVLVPAVQAIVALLRGDFSGAFQAARRLVDGTVETIRSRFLALPRLVFSALADLGQFLSRRMDDAGSLLVRTARGWIEAARDEIGKLPRQALHALGDLSHVLYDAGRDLIQGFIDGIKYAGHSLTSTVGGLMDGVGSFFGNSPAKEGRFSGRGWTLYSGEDLAADFGKGIENSRDRVLRATRSLMEGASQGLTGGPGLVARSTAVSPAGPTVVLNATFSNNGIIGSRTETLAWLTQSLDQLRREGRLPFQVASVR